MRLPSAVRSLSTRQSVALGSVMVLLLVMLAVYLQQGTDEGATVRTGNDVTTTERATTTTDDTTTTSAPTTTVVETTTTPTTAPPATAPPATAPPATAPPPATSGSLDMSAVLSFAKSQSGRPPVTYTGANVCPAYVKRPSDGGDDATRDITDWYLARYCDGVYRLASSTSDASPLDSFWMQADTGPGGCGGIDRVAIGWFTPSYSGAGAVIATPGCDASTWQWIDAAGYPVYSDGFLQLDFRETALGSPGSFSWRGFVRGAGENGSAIDAVPNGGPEHFVR